MLAATSAMVGCNRDNVSDNFCATGPPMVTSLSLCLKNQYISAGIVKHFLKEVKLFNHIFDSDFSGGKRELRVNVDFWPTASPTCCAE